MPRRSALAVTCAGLAAAAAVAQATGVTFSAFTSATSSGGNSISAAADFRAPTVSGTKIAKATGYDPDFVRQGGAYYVYANVTDTGNPPSGIATVTADVSALTVGQTAAPLASGSFTVGGVAYNRRSALLTVQNPLAPAAYTYSVTTADVAGNTATATGFGITVDNTAPTAADIQTANGGASAGTAEAGDTVTFTASEPIDPQSILAGWTGAATNVVVRLDNTIPSDRVRIYNAANTTLLPLGSVSLGRTDYVSTSRTFGATGTPSSMVRSGAAITVTLGTASGAATTAAGTGTMTWTPSTTAYDRGGTAMSATARTETGAADREF